MPMPTTRRGRYLFYRARAARRLKLARNRGPNGPNQINRRTGRRFDLSGYTKQVVWAKRVEPVHVPGFGVLWEAPTVTKPERGRWGVIPMTHYFPGFVEEPGHFQIAIIGYQVRRLISMPKPRHWPRLPYLHPHASLNWWDYFPLQTYPSGQHNPRGWLP